MTAASDLDVQHVIDSIPAMAWSARADGTGQFFNRHYLEYVGLTLAQVCEWQWTSVIHPEDLGLLMQTWERLRAAPAPGELQGRIRRHDGVYRWFSLRANPVCDPNGNVIKWYGVNIDIEGQKRAALMLEAERQVLESIARTRPLHQVLSALCLVVEQAFSDCHCEVRVLDRTRTLFEHVFAPSLPPGFSASAIGARLASDNSPAGMAAAGNICVIAQDLHTDLRWQETPVLAHLMAHGLRSAWSTPFLSSTGAVLGTLCVYGREPSTPQADHHGIIDRMTRIASIAIERLRAEDELRRRQYLLETAERISETGSFSWDMSNNKLTWSTQMYRIHEIDEAVEPIYTDVLALIHPDDAENVRANVAKAFNGDGSADGEYRLLMPDGRIKYLSMSYRVITHDDGRRESFGVARDITRRRLAEDALDKVRSELAHVTRVASLGHLAASITHEVNQPLAGIITNASTCLRMFCAGEADPDRALKSVERIIRDGHRASEVIKRLRALFRRQDFTAALFNLNEAAQEVIAICSHDLQRRRIALTVDFEQTLPEVVGDRIQLQQVILNLVLNAADAIEASAHQPRQIAVQTRRATFDAVQLAVRDTGCGITPDALNKVFEAFYTTKPNGMGIGLSVSKFILERHDGQLWASANQGAGATFSFAIPCAPRGRSDAQQPHGRIDEVRDETKSQTRERRHDRRGYVRIDAATACGRTSPGLGVERRSDRDGPQAPGGLVARSRGCFRAAYRGDAEQAGQ